MNQPLVVFVVGTHHPNEISENLKKRIDSLVKLLLPGETIEYSADWKGDALRPYNLHSQTLTPEIWVVPSSLDITELPSQECCIRAEAMGLVSILLNGEEDQSLESQSIRRYIRSISWETFSEDEILKGECRLTMPVFSSHQTDRDDIEYRRRLLAAFTHELRTPLNSIQGMTDLSLEKVQDPEVRDFLGVSKDAVSRLLVLINDIIDYSRMSEQGVSVKPAPFEITNSLKTLVIPWIYECKKKGLQFSLHIDPKIPSQILSDEERVHQALNNLISNAVKFTEAGSVSLHVTRGASELVFIVRNTGREIPENRRKKIFEPFYQAEGGRNRGFGGTGIGLTISTLIAQYLRGKLSLEYSTPLETSFMFQLPVHRESASHTIGDEIRKRLEDIGSCTVGVICDNNKQPSGLIAWLKEAFEGVEIVFTPEESTMEGRESPDLLFLSSELELDSPRLRSLIHYTARPIVFGSTGLGSRELQWRRVNPHGLFLPISASVEDFTTTIHQARDIPVSEDALDAKKFSGQLDGVRVLVVEDDGINRLVFTKHLEKMGALVWEAGNAEEAIAILQSETVDICCLDIGLPRVSGFEIARRIRDGEIAGVARQLPIIAVTAYSSHDDARKMYLNGINAILVKPVRGAALESSISQILLDFQKPDDQLDLSGLCSRAVALVRQGKTELVEKSIAVLKRQVSGDEEGEVRRLLFKLLLAVRRDDIAGVTDIITQMEPLVQFDQGAE
ncbi:hybrid sensor histidine kinase/response regulator [Spirochaeta lutea]|uniref:histidine kinase n=1 Tax=Spirochaeta lutea TaxID=1480694 RepID=A0A098R164_9SPIO|nr:hybrid sensor histidine kinase/response regulator [Spirochaeta lutea]KGE73845.1 hypothetical protein DC28_01125 [Spirochaeta lutea]